MDSGGFGEIIAIDFEMDVKISVLPFKNCYIAGVFSYDDRHDFLDMYEVNDLDSNDHRLLRVVMSTNDCDDVGEVGVLISIDDAVQRKLIGDKFNYIPYQVIKDCKDGDVVDYIVTLPYYLHILLHMKCEQIPIDASEFTNVDTANLFTKFDTAVDKCKSRI